MYLVWKLVLDGRVPWFVKLVLIAPLVFLATPIARIPWKFRTVPVWKMSYQPPVTSAGTWTRGYFVSRSSVAQ